VLLWVPKRSQESSLVEVMETPPALRDYLGGGEGIRDGTPSLCPNIDGE